MCARNRDVVVRLPAIAKKAADPPTLQQVSLKQKLCERVMGEECSLELGKLVVVVSFLKPSCLLSSECIANDRLLGALPPCYH